jgi:hypothetical protein
MFCNVIDEVKILFVQQIIYVLVKIPFCAYKFKVDSSKFSLKCAFLSLNQYFLIFFPVEFTEITFSKTICCGILYSDNFSEHRTRIFSSITL